jgi:uncharacterized protein YcnI
MGKALRAAGIAAAATAVAVLGFGSAASAHVTISGGPAPAGGNARIAFEVPTESDTASTTKLEVQLPTDHPIPSVDTAPVPGWSVSVDTTKLSTPIKTDDGDVSQVVSKITWTASSPDAAIKPGQFGEFPVALDAIPDTDKLVFKVLQTYSDGSVVRWIDEPTSAGTEPEHPAPVLTLTKGDPSAPATPAAAATRPDTGVRTLGVVGVVLGALGLVLGALALVLVLVRGRRATNPADPA